MKILALGATGAIGREVVSLLAPGQHEIHVTSRRGNALAGNVRYVQGDAQDQAFLRTLLSEHWDVIIDFMVYDTPSFRRRVDALLGATGQYIFISTARVFAQSDAPLVEDSPRLLDTTRDADFLASDEYAVTKARQENLLRDSGLRNWTIARPYISFGEGRLQLGPLEKEAWLYRAVQGRSILFCEPMLGKWTTMTDGADVARMLAALVGNPGALGQAYNLVGAHAVTWQQVLSLYLEMLEAHLGRRPRVSLLDVEDFCLITRSTPQVRYDRMYDRRFDTTKMSALLDPISLADPLAALRQRLATQLAQGGFLPVDWQMEGIKDRLTGERTGLQEMPTFRMRRTYLSRRFPPKAALSFLRSR